MRPTVCDTVGPEWPRRSEMRARSGTMPSSSSSRTVRRYISVVSMRSVIQASSGAWAGSPAYQRGQTSASSHGRGRRGGNRRIGAMSHVLLPREILPADGRFGCGPSKVRPAQLEALTGADGGAARHVAPAGAGEGPRRARARRARRAVPPARRLRDHPRQRRIDRVLGCRRLRPDREAQPEPRVRRVRRQVRLRREGSVARGPRHPRGAGRHPHDRRGRSRASTSTRGRTTRPRRASRPRSRASPATPAP